MRWLITVLVLLCLVYLPGAGVRASGELPSTNERGTQQNRASSSSPSDQLSEDIQAVREASARLYSARMAACQAAQRETWKYARQTTVLGCVQDRFGDPLYCRQGPRAYAGTPDYNGPSYVSSFAYEQAPWTADRTYRGYYRQVYSHPQVSARTDVSLGIGATHSYFQSGMLMNPGSQAPVASRVMINNSYY